MRTRGEGLFSASDKDCAIPAQTGNTYVPCAYLCLSERVTDVVTASLLRLEKPEPVFAAQQLAPQDLSVLTVLSTAAAQQEDLLDCLASCSKSGQAKTEHLHMACKDAVSAFESQQICTIPNITGYLHAATAVARAVQAALRSGSVSSCSTHVILGKDVPADVREETNQFIQNLCKSAPAGFWESVMDDIEAIKATTSVVLVKYATNNAIQVKK